MNNIEKITYLLKVIDAIRKDENLGNIFYNEQYIELLIAEELNHEWNDGQGADAFDNGKNIEYKTINSIDGSGSFQFHWITTDNVDEYLKYEDVYFVWRDGMELKEIYKSKMKDIFPYLKEKAKSNGEKGHWSVSKKSLLNKLNPCKVK